MRTTTFDLNNSDASRSATAPAWFDLTDATVEVSSEQPDHPIENALSLDVDESAYWAAAAYGVQVVRVVFDEPRRLSRIHVVFEENTLTRSQEFAIAWSTAETAELTTLFRQQWNFSPDGSRTEVEDFTVALDGVKVLQITIDPDRGAGHARATMQRLRFA